MLTILSFTNFWVDLIIFVTVLFSIIYYCISTFNVWKKLNVPYIRPIPLFGNYLNVALGIEHPIETYKKIYYELAGHKYGGMFQMRTPYLMIRDPEIINNILIKDFSYFTDRGIYVNFSNEPLSEILFLMENPRWKILRSKLSPAFTSGKLKQMYSQIEECGNAMVDNICSELKKNPNEIDVRDILGQYSTDVIGTCSFGLKLNVASDDTSLFRSFGKTAFQSSLLYFLREICVMISPAIMKIIRLPFFPNKTTEFFGSVFKETMAYRKKNNIVRTDIVHCLIQAHQDLVVDNNSSNGVGLTGSQILSNAFGFFAAGFETTSTTLSFCLYELALKKNIQDRVREEIKLTKIKYNGVIDNEFLNDLIYLDMVIAETIRKYPVLFALFRVATKTYRVPNDSLIIEKGQKIIIPTFSLHFDPRYFSDPEVFNPERFSAEENAKRPNGVYLPFGNGPRICIGKRFAEMEMKLALVDILSKFEVEPCEKTEIPIQFSKLSLLVIPKDEKVWLKLNPISE
ncbi:probable cytochrome P450 6a13 isoform X1 [Rhopalosiphum padi]|uniref:Cytochrome P450 CYP6CY8 n=1 Tax=Rhopalosiphum padi TaxID=40932 RepID=A0A7T3R126_RHOPD|nr:probable cytochrome P450 6a13 isoform X1 [Rhopalosiphum padi]QPZ88884.1 cytochrome P450 CYP6CY8 [Rhopalosiphum padi]WOV89629.1 cytochrome P450 CYP6CY8 [Rhopalosiphum padi]